MTSLLRDAPRWLFLATLLYAPWAWGSTRLWSIAVLNGLLAMTAALWLLGCAIRRTRPAVHPACALLAASAAAYGWWMTLNAGSIFDPEYFRFARVERLCALLPGSVDRATSWAAMERLTALLVAVCFANDLTSRPEWRRRVVIALSLAATSTAAFGVLQRASNEPFVTWENVAYPGFYFALYRNPNNAAALLNIVLPLTLSQLLVAIRHRDAHIRRAVWATASLIAVTAAFVNGSRSGAIISAVVLVAIVPSFAIQFWNGKSLTPRSVRLVYAILIVSGLLVLAASGWSIAADRWKQMPGQLVASNGRYLVDGVLLRMIRDSGTWGFGPGTFAMKFPYYTGPLGTKVAGIWLYAHQDYLQTVVEWGFAGAALWAALIFGGLGAMLRTRVLKAKSLPFADRTLLIAAALGLASVLLHALVDFPLQIASVQLYAATLIGLGWSSLRWAAPPPERRSAS